MITKLTSTVAFLLCSIATALGISLEQAVQFVADFEGCRLTAYKDAVGKWTIGYGHTGSDVKPGMTITHAEALRLLQEDFSHALEIVDQEVQKEVNLTDNERYALASFTFNTGVSNLRNLINQTNKSNPNIPRLNEGNRESIRLVLPMYDKAGGKRLAGLTRRRAAEVKLFFTKD